MVKWLQILLTVCIATNAMAAGSIFEVSCRNVDEPVSIEGVDQPTCYCYGPGDSGTIFNWTIVHDNGQSKTLGTCYGVRNCTSSFAPSVLLVTMDYSYSSLNFVNLTSQFSGVITCTQTNRTFQGSVSTTLKTARIRVHQCLGGISLLEGSTNIGMSCDYSPYTPSTVSWTIITSSGQALPAGSCSSSENYVCKVLLSSNVTMTAQIEFTDILFKTVYRDMATAVCSVSYSDSNEADNCTIDVFNPAVVENCSLEINSSNWSFIASCDVSNDYSSEGRYEFTLIENFALLKTDHVVDIYGEIFTLLSYRNYLAPYTDATTNKVYYRGRVVHTWPLPPYPGTYRSFTFQTHQAGDSDINAGIDIGLPVRPTHNCSDVTTPCSCSTETLGSPAGRLLWLIGNTTVAIGDYGVNQLWLPSDNLPDGEDVMVAICRLDWIQSMTAREPAILRKTLSDNDYYKTMTIVSWTMCGVVVILVLILVTTWLRQERSSIWPCSKPEQTDQEVEPRNYGRL